MQKHINTEQRNLAGLTPAEQVAMNTAGCLLLREIFGKAGSCLDVDWLAVSVPQKTAICTIARLPRNELMSATLSTLPHQQREVLRLAVIALKYQKLFRCGCDSALWHQAPTTRPMRDIEREKKERAARLRMKRAVLAGSEMSKQSPRALGQQIGQQQIGQ